ncbi:MAG TPA: MurT ligase domain-containing protein [Oculatellaceae cyanobacterium]
MNKLAILTGKLTAQAIRLSGAGLASNLPGRLARKVSQNVLGQLARQARNGVVAVTGTNGKSTTSGLLSSILTTAGLDIVHNYQGANLVTGITACLVDASSWDGKLDTDYCVFEIDEAAFPLVAAEADIQAVVVTNLFRDQLDRFGELDTTASLIEKGIKVKNSLSILNADDPNVSQLAPQSKRIYFGITSLNEDEDERKHSHHKRNHSTTDGAIVQSGHKEISNAELGYCGKCGQEVHYEEVYYGQLGRWACSNCDNRRPQPDVYATNVRLFPDHSRFTLHLNGDETEVHLLIPGLFNVYNALAAAAAAQSLHITHESIRHGLKEYKTLFGRSEKISISGKEVFIQLIKNPAGTSQAVSAVVADEKSHVLIAINDNLADGRDISWLWDADFEQLGEKNRRVTVSGQRAEDMALRMKYAGTSSDNITVVPGLSKALDDALAATPPDHTLWLLPTYTCLLELQKILKARGISLSKT